MADAVVVGGPYLPIQAWNFRVEVSDFGEAKFSEASPIGEWESDVIEQPEGGSDIPDKQPGKVKFPDLVLKHPASADTRFVDWAEQCRAFSGTPGVPKRNLDVVAMDRNGDDINRFRYKKGFVRKIAHGAFNAGSSDNLMVELTVAHDGWKLVP